MKEILIHFIWQNLLFDTTGILSIDNSKVQIINQGIINNNSGPDFLNAKIRINNTLWAGNIEIHIKSGDWQLHNHTSDKNYNNTILHVCWEYDKPAYRSDGSLIQCITLNNLVKKELLDRYNYLMNNKSKIPCGFFIRNIDEITWKMWEERLVIERLESKTFEIFNVLKNNKYDWHQAFYEKVAWSFGLKINAENFLNLAQKLPVRTLSKHKNNIFQLEALLFGVAGFLTHNKGDEYYISLKKEYSFLKQKYKLQELNEVEWKFLRLMPANFPTVRLAQFAYLIHKSENLFIKIIENIDLKYIESLFTVSTSSYWETHYNFESTSSKRIKKTGNISIHNIIINTIIPFLFAYGKYKDNEELKEKSIALLQKLKIENNSIIRKWQEFGINPKNSFQTQAILQLNNEYCNKFNCLNCNIGFKILKNGNS